MDKRRFLKKELAPRVLTDWRYPGSVLVLLIVIVGAVVVSLNMRARQQNDAGAKIVPLSIRAGDHVLGNRSAPVTVFMFTDPECPYCKRFFLRHLQNLQVTYGDSVSFVYKHFLLKKYTRSFAEAVAIECAARVRGESMFWTYFYQLLRTTASEDRLAPAALSEIAGELDIHRSSFDACRSDPLVAKKIRTDVIEGSTQGLYITPSFIVTDGNETIVVEGDFPIQIDTAIKHLLKARPE